MTASVNIDFLCMGKKKSFCFTSLFVFRRKSYMFGPWGWVYDGRVVFIQYNVV